MEPVDRGRHPRIISATEDEQVREGVKYSEGRLERAMSEQHSVTAWFEGLHKGDAEAMNRLVERYFDLLVGVGRQKYRRTFGDIPRPAEDEEDAALSALDSFCADVKEGRIRDLQ